MKGDTTMSKEYELVLITNGGTISPQGQYFDTYNEAKIELKRVRKSCPNDKWDIVKCGTYWIV